MKKDKIKKIIISGTILTTSFLITLCNPVTSNAQVAYNVATNVWESNYGSDFTGLDNNENGWWYIENGIVRFDYNGIKPNDFGWWKITNGAVDFNYTGLASNEYGWWYVENGSVNFNYTGIKSNDYGWWKVTNGAVDFSYNGIADNEYGWWYLENGAVNFNYTGVSENEFGVWYIENGEITFNYNGTAEYNGQIYNVVDSKLDGAVSNKPQEEQKPQEVVETNNVLHDKAGNYTVSYTDKAMFKHYETDPNRSDPFTGTDCDFGSVEGAVFGERTDGVLQDDKSLYWCFSCPLYDTCTDIFNEWVAGNITKEQASEKLMDLVIYDWDVTSYDTAEDQMNRNYKDVDTLGIAKCVLWVDDDIDITKDYAQSGYNLGEGPFYDEYSSHVISPFTGYDSQRNRYYMHVVMMPVN